MFYLIQSKIDENETFLKGLNSTFSQNIFTCTLILTIKYKKKKYIIIKYRNKKIFESKRFLENNIE